MKLCNTFMMRCLLVIVMAWCGYGGVLGQKNDYVWLSGYDSYANPDTGGGAYFGTTVMNFNQVPVNISYDSLAMNFDATNTSFCDSNGNLLFYSNGIYIANAFNEMVQNSDSLNAGWLQYEWDPTIQLDGYRLPQGILALQSVINPSQYYILYNFIDSVPGSNGNNIYCARVYSALLDMNANNGHGTVLNKNQTIIQGNIGDELTATRHGNGRDWWILAQKRNTNCYYKLLLDSTGVLLIPELNCGGSITDSNGIGACSFSPDGSKYVYFSGITGINIFDFDRCTGELSNPVFIPYTVLYDSGWLGMGVAISPNNRFLYVTATKYVFQYDLQAADVASSVTTIAVYDNYNAPFGSYFNTARLGPDGKIYISCGNADSVYHVINYPDSPGIACNFVQHGVHLQSASLGVPNFPNYRLGALTQSQCDTLAGLNEVQRATQEQILKVYPNPATDYTIIDYGFTDWNKGQPNLEICNALGQIVFTQTLPMYSGFQKINVQAFAAGVYTVYIKRNNGVVANAKFVKQ